MRASVGQEGLVEEYGYPKSDIDVEVTVPMGRERKRVDLAVYKHDAPHKTENVLIFIETKRDDKKLTEDDEEQFMSYMAAAMSLPLRHVGRGRTPGPMRESRGRTNVSPIFLDSGPTRPSAQLAAIWSEPMS